MRKVFWMIVGALASLSISVLAQDWFQASGVPAQRSLLNSAELRSEFAAIESDIADKLPALTGNGGFLVAVNSGGTALEALSTGISVAQGGTGATTLTGLLQGNGTSAITGITNSSTTGEVLRVTGASTYAWGALDLANGDAITGDLPDDNLSANVPLLDVGNTFTSFMDVGDVVGINMAAPIVRWSETDAGTDEQHWLASVNSDIYRIGTASDAAANTLANAGIRLLRTGTTINEVELNATALDFNGAADFSSTVLAASGSAGAPAFAFSSDSDSGMYLASDGIIGIGTAGSPRVAIGSALVQLANATEIDLTGTTLDFNGAADFSSTVAITGLATFSASGSRANAAIQLTGASSALYFQPSPAGPVANSSNWSLITFDNGDGTSLFQVATSTDADAFGDGAIEIARSGTTLTALDLTATTITFNGDGVATGSLAWGGGSAIASSDDLSGSTDTFTSQSVTSCSGTEPTVTYAYTKLMDIVVLELTEDLNCTSDSATFAMTSGDVPALIRPASDLCFPLNQLIDNGTASNGAIRLTTAGQIIYGLQADTNANCGSSENSFTASGNKQVYPYVITYHLN